MLMGMLDWFTVDDDDDLGLDCNTPRGRIYIARQRVIARYFGELLKCDVIRTPEHKRAIIDLIISRRGETRAEAEVKARNLTRRRLEMYGRHGGSLPPGYLITHDKVEKGRWHSAGMCVPLLIIVGLYDDERHDTLREIIYWKVTDARGNYLFPSLIHQTQTKKTVNSTTADICRTNMFLPLDKMYVLSVTPRHESVPRQMTTSSAQTVAANGRQTSS